MTQKILITSALLYANGPLHFGHLAGAYLPADIYARFERLRGHDVHYISGSDEYGMAITLSAELAGRTPVDHVNFFHEINRSLFQRLSFSFDHYSRTTWKGHTEPVQRFFLDLYENGWIEAKITEQLYSELEGKFLADRYVVGVCPSCGFNEARGDECPSCGSSFEAIELKNPRSKLTHSPLVRRATKHWFLLLDKFKDRLTSWIAEKNWKPNVVRFIEDFIKGLHPRSITRDINWGIPVPLPEANGKVLYVWFDAPIGYISASREWAELKGEPDAWKEYWLSDDTKLVHFIGKDNIPFHGVIFPAMCMGQNLPLKLVDELPANEFLNLEGRQFSKSDNWTIDLNDFLTRYSVDQVRYALAAMSPETGDSEFTFREFQTRCNSELLGKLGNFVHRTLTFVQANLDGKIPQRGRLEDEDQKFLDGLIRYQQQAEEAFSSFRVRGAVQALMELAQAGNVYFDLKKPWLLKKDPEAKEKLLTTLNLCLQAIQLIGVIAQPIIPDGASKILAMVGKKQLLWREALQPLSNGSLPKPELLFRRIEDEEIEKEMSQLKQVQKQETTSDIKPEITFDLIEKLDLRVGQIVSAEKIPKSQKLLKLQVDLGTERRQIVAGIGASLAPEAILGKKVIVVVNLKKTKLMGVESQGMILAGGESHLELPSFSELPLGSVVK